MDANEREYKPLSRLAAAWGDCGAPSTRVEGVGECSGAAGAAALGGFCARDWRGAQRPLRFGAKDGATA
jgi:hypothetical protein